MLLGGWDAQDVQLFLAVAAACCLHLVDLQMGIVGLPNVGKSTLFNVLTKLSIPAENFPFCTIEPNQVRNLTGQRTSVHGCVARQWCLGCTSCTD
jgi:hypothetical protein